MAELTEDLFSCGVLGYCLAMGRYPWSLAPSNQLGLTDSFRNGFPQVFFSFFSSSFLHHSLGGELCHFFFKRALKSCSQNFLVVVSNIFIIFTPISGKIPNLTFAYFSNGLVQPPTRFREVHWSKSFQVCPGMWEHAHWIADLPICLLYTQILITLPIYTTILISM